MEIKKTVNVEGEQVITLHCFFELMQAQGCRIDRATAIARTAIIIAICAASACIYILLR